MTPTTPSTVFSQRGPPSAKNGRSSQNGIRLFPRDPESGFVGASEGPDAVHAAPSNWAKVKTSAETPSRSNLSTLAQASPMSG
jgi:hypothetical protein